MATGQPFDEGFDETVRAVFRPGPNPSPSGKLRVANLFCGAGSLSQAAQEAGMEITYAHDSNSNRRTRAAYAREFGIAPDHGELPDFATIPPSISSLRRFQRIPSKAPYPSFCATCG